MSGGPLPEQCFDGPTFCQNDSTLNKIEKTQYSCVAEFGLNTAGGKAFCRKMPLLDKLLVKIPVDNLPESFGIIFISAKKGVLREMSIRRAVLEGYRVVGSRWSLADWMSTITYAPMTSVV